MGSQNFGIWRPNLANTGSVETSGPSTSGLIFLASGTGSPTAAYVDGGSEGGEIEVDLNSNGADAQNGSLYMGDSLAFDIDQLVEAIFRFKLKQAALDATTQFALGLTGDRNDAIDSIAQAMLMRIIGGDDTTAVVVESDDGTNNNDDIATGKSIADTAVHEFKISLAKGKADVRFFLDGQPVAQGTTFDMSNYSGALQFLGQIQKTADTNVDGWKLIDAIVRYRRVLVA